MMLAQNNVAIEQARLHQDMTSPTSGGVDANGTAVATPESSSSDDDSFGAQMILKNQERVRSFVLSGDVGLAYTNNVALTRRGERYDVFAIVDAGLGWSKRLSDQMEANVSAHASIFRYDRTPSLDFENLGFGAGLSWSPRNVAGVSAFARYDFTEMLDRDGGQILMEHALTVGVQKAIALGRSHGFVFGTSATAALDDPAVAQREQIGAFLSYHLQLSRDWSTDVFYRPAVHFYTQNNRTDFNQIVSLGVHYHMGEAAEFNASLSYGFNRSDRSVFDYDVLTTSAALGLSIRF